MSAPPLRKRVRWVAAWIALLVAVTGLASATTSVAAPQAVGDTHTQKAYAPTDDFTMKWTRADAQKIMEYSNPNATPKTNSIKKSLIMPDIPVNFPVMKDKNGKQVWVWDTWPLTDDRGNQYSYKGWTVIFALTADPYAGYTFDDRHVNARISYWYHKSSNEKAPWIYGGLLFGNTTPKTQAEWSGSTRIFGENSLKVFYTHMDFADREKPIAKIALRTGKIQADKTGVWFTGMSGYRTLLEPDGKYYQTVKQNQYYSFRDPFTFTDPAQPGKTYMVFEGNTGGERGAYQCQDSDLGDSGESASAVTASGANFQMANIGLAIADNTDLTKWTFLPPILSGNCVNDQTERPQFVIKKVDGQWKYYLFTISHAFTYAAGLRGPDGVYGFVGDAIRSDFQPLNESGLALGNPTNLNYSPGNTAGQDVRQYQAYSHYVMPGGLVESFIDSVDGRRGGTLAPTVKLKISGATTTVDRSVGNNGLLGYGYIPANKKIGSISSAPDAGTKRTTSVLSVR